VGLLGELRSVLANVVLQPDVVDQWVWRHVPSYGYFVRGAYQVLTAVDVQVTADTSALIWHKQVPSKVSVMAWRLLRDRLRTKDNLVRQHIIPPDASFCVAGCGDAETTHTTCSSLVRSLPLCRALSDLWLAPLQLIRCCFTIIFSIHLFCRRFPSTSLFYAVALVML
jgi:hypothetical protein